MLCHYDPIAESGTAIGARAQDGAERGSAGYAGLVRWMFWHVPIGCSGCLRRAACRGLLGWPEIIPRVGDDPVTDSADRPGRAQVAEVAAPQPGQADRADRQRDAAEPQQWLRGHGSA